MSGVAPASRVGVKEKCEQGSQGGVKTRLLGVECRCELLRASGKQTKGGQAGAKRWHSPELPGRRE